jgi:carboxymethylenebutenolidase
MCFDIDSQPPELPGDLVLPRIAGGAGAELLELSSEDGTQFSAALAESPEGREPGVLIFPDVRGLYPFYSELAERFAQAGHNAIVIDYFGRTAGLGPRGADFDYMPHVMKTTVEKVQADASAALDALRDRTGVSGAVSVGFCFGGLQSFLAGADPELGLDGVVGFYGPLDGSRFGMAGPLQRAREITCPVLGLFGGADDAIPADQVEAFESLLAEAGIDHEIHIYPGAPHSFFDRKFDEHAETSEDAWRRVLSFLGATAARAKP